MNKQKTTKQKIPAELIQFINTGSKFIIAGHKEPDGDCVGSQLALCSVLQRMGKQAIVCSSGPFTRNELRFFVSKFTLNVTDKFKKNAKLIIVDCSAKDRIGDIQEFIDDLPFAVIDHHKTGTHLNSTLKAPVYIDPTAPSCTLMIEKLITALKMDLNSEESSYLLFGICTDTGFFHYLDENNADVFNTSARLVNSGASPNAVHNILNGGKKLNSRLLLGRVLSRIKPYYDGKMLLSYETFNEYKHFGLESNDSEAMYNLLQSIEGVEVTVIIRQELADNCTVSLRSLGKIDVSQIAASFGGGGHRNASGFTIDGSISNVRKTLIKSFNNVFKSK